MNKASENLLPVFSWTWKQDLLETLSRFPPSREQRDVASFHDLTKSEINLKFPRNSRRSRMTEVEGVETEEFIFVEMDANDLAFRISRGVDVAPGRVAAG